MSETFGGNSTITFHYVHYETNIFVIIHVLAAFGKLKDSEFYKADLPVEEPNAQLKAPEAHKTGVILVNQRQVKLPLSLNLIYVNFKMIVSNVS